MVADHPGAHTILLTNRTGVVVLTRSVSFPVEVNLSMEIESPAACGNGAGGELPGFIVVPGSANHKWPYALVS